jgi:hypothetical protein
MHTAPKPLILHDLGSVATRLLLPNPGKLHFRKEPGQGSPATWLILDGRVTAGTPVLLFVFRRGVNDLRTFLTLFLRFKTDADQSSK